VYTVYSYYHHRQLIIIGSCSAPDECCIYLLTLLCCIITGPTANSVEGQTNNGRGRLSSSSVTLHGGPEGGGQPSDDVMRPPV